MKNLKKITVAFCCMAVLTSCSKDQKVNNWLSDGTWTTTSMTMDGVDILFGSVIGEIEHVYEDCKMKDGPCVGESTFSWTDTSGTHAQTTNYTYTILDKGEKLETDVIGMITDDVAHDCLGNCSIDASITESSETKMVLN